MNSMFTSVSVAASAAPRAATRKPTAVRIRKARKAISIGDLRQGTAEDGRGVSKGFGRADEILTGTAGILPAIGNHSRWQAAGEKETIAGRMHCRATGPV